MDNSLLLINTKNIRDLAFLDDDCDAPVDMDWDYEVSSGEIPGIFYDMFPDYAGVKEAIAQAQAEFMVEIEQDDRQST